MKTEDYKENCMNKYNETRLLLCSGIHEVKALFFLLIFYISLDFPMERHRKSTTEGVIPLGLTNSSNFCISLYFWNVPLIQRELVLYPDPFFLKHVQNIYEH